jgi:hypothetical protein
MGTSYFFDEAKMLELIKDRRYMTVWWALMWRSLVAMLVGFFGGSILGFVIGFILGSAGISILVIKIVCGIAGAILGFGTSLYPLKFLIGKDLGGFRLEIVHNEN